MKTKKRFTRTGFEGTAARLGAIDRELRLDTLRNSGDLSRPKIVLSGKDKASCPRRQRKARKWHAEL